MKKLLCTALALCLLFALSANVFAAEFANMYTLLQYWEENGYPDDVGSIYSTDGSPYNFTVQLVGDDITERADEIRAMLIDPSTVTFEKGQFTDKQLHEIRQEIQDTYMTDGISSVSVGWGNAGGFGASGKELRVVVTTDEAHAIDLAQTLGQRYGEAVAVQIAAPEAEEIGEPKAEEPEAEEPEAPAEPEAQSPSAPTPPTQSQRIPEKTESAILWITFLVLGAAAVCLLLLARRKKK